MRKTLIAALLVLSISVLALCSCDSSTVKPYSGIELSILGDLIDDVSQYNMSPSSLQKFEQIVAVFQNPESTGSDISAAITELYSIKNDILNAPIGFLDGTLESRIKESLGMNSSAVLTYSDIMNITELDLSWSEEYQKINFIDDLGKFLNIKKLDLSGNSISDFSSLSNLVSLTYLNISNNAEENRTVTGLDSIYSLPSVSYLDISYNNIPDIKGISSLYLLKSLNISGNAVSDFSELSSLPYFSELIFRDSVVSSVSAFVPLTNLSVLDLSNTVIPDSLILSCCIKLESLSISGGKPSIVTSLGNLALTSLVAEHCDISDIEFLSSMTSITHLDLSDNAISDITVLHFLTGLVSLDLSNNRIVAAHLGDTSSLMSLNLSHNRLTDIQFSTPSPALSSLDLSDNKLKSVDGLDAPWLTEVYLSDNSFKDLAFLSSSVNLKTLIADNVPLKNIGFTGLTKLTYLSLYDNYLTDCSVIGECTSLQYLDLRLSDVKKIDFLSDLSKLVTLKLSLHKVSDITVLESLSGLEELSLRGMKTPKGCWDVFEKMLSLRSLEIVNCYAPDPSISAMPELESLRFEDCPNITDTAGIYDNPKLKELYFSGADIPSPIVVRLPSLEKLTITGCDVEYVNGITDLPNLTYLDLSHNDFESLEFGTLTEMKFLDLSYGRIYNLKDFNLPLNGGTLILKSNSISEIGPLLLHNEKLEYLDISDNKIKNFDPLSKMEIGEVVAYNNKSKYVPATEEN